MNNYFAQMKQATSALNGEFLYSIVFRLAQLESQDPDSVNHYKAQFEDILKDKPLMKLAAVKTRLTSKKSMSDLSDDVKYLRGKYLSQFLRECQHYAGQQANVSTEPPTGLRDWLIANSEYRHLSV